MVPLPETFGHGTGHSTSWHGATVPRASGRSRKDVNRIPENIRYKSQSSRRGKRLSRGVLEGVIGPEALKMKTQLPSTCAAT
jgi:hypothetical protein